MKKILIFLISGYMYALSMGVQAQIDDLEIIGQTPGGAGYHVNWDQDGQKLIVGCGTSIWVYDMSDPENPVIVAKRPLLGIVNETEIYGDTLFAAATHDGVFALDYSSPGLDVIAHYDMKSMGDTAAYDMWRSNDTLYIADYFTVRMLKFNASTGFTKIGSFGGPKSFCVARRGNYIAVGNTSTLVTNGNIQIFSTQNLSAPVATWSSPYLNWVQDLQFADLRDDILYVCGGPENILFTESNFFAFQWDGALLTVVDTFELTGGIPLLAQLNVMNMDSRNDTVFLVTTAAFDTASFPLSYMPVIDATGLPGDTMKEIAHITPGLWHFDAALMHGTPYIAMSSEWLGVLVSDISALAFDDTLGLLPTGGWCVNNEVKDNLLLAAHEGFGMIAWNIDSLLFDHGFQCDAKEMHIHDLNKHYFSSDMEFLNDTLLMVNSTEVYNIQPWQQGGQIVLDYDMEKNFMVCMKRVYSNTGMKMVATYSDNISKPWIDVFDPFDHSGNYQRIYIDTTDSDPFGIEVFSDTIYYGRKYGADNYLVAQKIEDNQVVFLDSIKLTNTWGALSADVIHGISVDNGIIAVAYGPQFALFRWNGNELEELFTNFSFTERYYDCVLRNGYIYVADKFYGMKVFDISSLTEATLVAQCRGTGGWLNLYGSRSLSVASDGYIYLSDFHAGVLIIEPFDTTFISVEELENNDSPFQNLRMYPNPSTGIVNIELSQPGEIFIFNSNGQLIYSVLCDETSAQLNLSTLPQGLYYVCVMNSDGIKTSKLLLSK
jgi:hypothetical protein